MNDYRIVLITSLLAIIVLASCNNKKEEIDVQANDMLQTSRQLLGRSQYDAARDTLLSMRRRYPTAIGARKQGILLLDSIEMIAAGDSLGTVSGKDVERLQMKTMFYQRKLREDLKKQVKSNLHDSNRLFCTSHP